MYTYVSTYVRRYVCTSVRTYMHKYVYIYIYIYISLSLSFPRTSTESTGPQQLGTLSKETGADCAALAPLRHGRGSDCLPMVQMAVSMNLGLCYGCPDSRALLSGVYIRTLIFGNSPAWAPRCGLVSPNSHE